MVAKRALNFGTPASKRRKVDTKMVIVRGIKPEMKFKTFPIAHTATTGANLAISNIDQATSIDGRVGNKLKIHFVEGLFYSPSSVNFRVELVRLNDSTTAPSNSYSQLTDRTMNDVLSLEYFTDHGGLNTGNSGSYWSHSLPYGNICKYQTSAGSTCNKNELTVRTTSPVSNTISGEIRVWYTDV